MLGVRIVAYGVVPRKGDRDFEELRAERCERKTVTSLDIRNDL